MRKRLETGKKRRDDGRTERDGGRRTRRIKIRRMIVGRRQEESGRD